MLHMGSKHSHAQQVYSHHHVSLVLWAARLTLAWPQTSCFALRTSPIAKICQIPLIVTSSTILQHNSAVRGPERANALVVLAENGNNDTLKLISSGMSGFLTSRLRTEQWENCIFLLVMVSVATKRCRSLSLVSRTTSLCVVSLPTLLYQLCRISATDYQ
jgi:hypothetical protein